MTFTADSLIEVFGDQAYHKGVRMAVEALQAGDREACRQLAAANIELIRRGYHKKPRDAPRANAEQQQPAQTAEKSHNDKTKGTADNEHP